DMSVVKLKFVNVKPVHVNNFHELEYWKIKSHAIYNRLILRGQQ
ncbi:7513_t:CDS:1, partial [Dentiscutata heterogama]